MFVMNVVVLFINILLGAYFSYHLRHHSYVRVLQHSYSCGLVAHRKLGCQRAIILPKLLRALKILLGETPSKGTTSPNTIKHHSTDNAQ
ncbi:hypothetical protein F5B20DRAFT_530926 [Whalleya microplaca]|nr:hypothetical protein F5B20DRAFT_530926 [Whalleya microplaca]